MADEQKQEDPAQQVPTTKSTFLERLQGWLTPAVAIANLVLLPTIALQTCAARDSVDSQTRSLRLHDRPWLVESVITGPAEIQANQQYHLAWQIKNVGSIPAVNVRGESSASLLESSKAFVPDYGHVDRDGASVGVIGEGETLALHVDVKVGAQQDVDAIMNMKGRLYAFAHVEYEGPGGPPGQLTFCAYYDPRTKTWPHCPNYNMAK